MARCYNASMHKRQTRPYHSAHPLPKIWLISDARNDALLEQVLCKAPQRLGFIYRHYHLDAESRRARYDILKRIADRYGHVTILSSNPSTAQQWRAKGHYGSPRGLYPKSTQLLTIATAHSMTEIAAANRRNADAVMLSPVFATRSHPGARCLGPLRFRLMARHAKMPVIALGGMNHHRAKRLRWMRWAAIDGLVMT